MSLKSLARLFTLLACFTAFVATGALAAAPAKPRNLLGNPSFERRLPAHDWMPAAWDTSDAGIPSVFFGRDSFFTHDGGWSVNIANTSTVFPMAHNWSQTLLVSRDWWGKNARFSIWTKSNGLQGRAYVMIQAYRDTASKMARIWGVDRDESRRRLGIQRIEDPSIDLGWKRLVFDDPQSDWVKREVSVYVPVGVNVLFVRGGMFGTGQVYFDDASLVLEPAKPVAIGTGNLFGDPGFESGGLAWEWVVPPFEGARADLDSTTTHSGRYSMCFSHMNDGLSSTRAGLAQSLSARGLAGKRIRLSAWFKADSLQSNAFLEIFAHTANGPKFAPRYEMLGGTFDWTRLQVEYDVPADAQTLWLWLNASAPYRGTVWFDDAELLVLGPAKDAPALVTPAKTPARPGRR